MTDPLDTVRARRLLEGGAPGEEEKPIKVGRFAPYPVWISVTLLIRCAQVLFFVFLIWCFAALVDAMYAPATMTMPPLWLWAATLILGASDGNSPWSWRTSPFGDAIGNLLASQQCPACGQNVFDHTPPSGYAPETEKHRMFPSRICTNCGHDLKHRTAS